MTDKNVCPTDKKNHNATQAGKTRPGLFQDWPSHASRRVLRRRTHPGAGGRPGADLRLDREAGIARIEIEVCCYGALPAILGQPVLLPPLLCPLSVLV